MKLYVRDWRGDLNLSSCSIAARGLWLEMCTLMHESEPMGYLIIGTKGLGLADAVTIALHCKVPDVPLVASLLTELHGHGVLSVDEQGTIYSRYLVRLAEKSNQAREHGRRGGNPLLLDLDGYPKPRLGRASQTDSDHAQQSRNESDSSISGESEGRANARISPPQLAPELRGNILNGIASQPPSAAHAELPIPAIDFARWFVDNGIAVGAIRCLDRELQVRREPLEIAAVLLRDFGRAECEARALRLFAAHLTTGPSQIRRPPTIDVLERWWDSAQLRAEPRADAGGADDGAAGSPRSRGSRNRSRLEKVIVETESGPMQTWRIRGVA